MDFNYIKGEIEQFKLEQKFEEEVYLRIMNDLDDLYKYKNNSILQITSNEYILNEKENFRKYLIGSLLQNANKEAKNKNFQKALENIQKLESLNPSEEVKKEIFIIKQFCEISRNCKQGEILISKKKFRKAINFFKYMKTKSNTVNNCVINGPLFIKYIFFLFNSFKNSIKLLIIKKKSSSS